MTLPASPVAAGPESSGRVLRLPTDPDPEIVGDEAIQRLESGEALPEFFQLSSADKAGVPPYLSVWQEELTTPRQAWVPVGARPDKRFLFYLPVDGVRAIVGGAGGAVGLDVCWFAAVGPDGSPETRPGATGHCGVTGLERGSRQDRKAMRSRLADLATRAGVRLMTDAVMTA